MKKQTTSHTKFKRLKRRLGLPDFQIVGILESLWHLTANEAPAGDIGKLSNEDIGSYMEWAGSDDELINHLVSSGWVDRDEKYRLIVHDWGDHCPAYIHAKFNRLGQKIIKGEDKNIGLMASSKNGQRTDSEHSRERPERQHLTKPNPTSLRGGRENSPNPSAPISDAEVKKLLEINKPE